MPVARLLTAAVLVVVLAGCVLFLPPFEVTLVFLLFLFAGALEWAMLAGLESGLTRSLYAVGVGGVGFGVWRLGTDLVPLGAVLGLATAWWLLALGWIVIYQRTARAVRLPRSLLLLLGPLVMVPALVALAQLIETRLTLLLGLFAIVWSADILAFFGGRRFGRARLASRVSPGKTWAGVYSAVGGTLVAALVLNHFWLGWPLLAFVALVSASLVAAIVGDLFESLVKRQTGHKDSGHLLPGHGGVLDRIDSVLAAAPVFTFSLRQMGYA